MKGGHIFLEENVEILYQIVINNSWSDEINNYYSFLIENATYYCENRNEVFELIDKVLKKIFTNLKYNIEIDRYDNIYVNMGRYKNNDAYDFMIGVIKTYYENEFKDGNIEYSTFDIMNTVVEQYKDQSTMSTPRIFHYMLATLFRIHYALYVMEIEK